MEIDEAADDKGLKCYNCGKVFATAQAIDRHKNRKTPCLIREVPVAHINNPNRCIYCNKIFTNIGNKNKHLKTCKVKNGGMDILVDKVKYEQEIRILKDQLAAEKKEKDEQIQKLAEKVAALEKAVSAPAVAQVPQTVNMTFNAPINIMINNYTTPTIAGVRITPAELASASKISKLLLQKLYFNPDVPQNHCIYLQNKKDKSMIVYDEGRWQPVAGGNTEVFMKLSNALSTIGVDFITGRTGPYLGEDSKFLELSQVDRQKIYDFNVFKDILERDDAYEVFLGGRDVVISTIKAAGCKLV